MDDRTSTMLLPLLAATGIMTEVKPGHIKLKDDEEYEDDPPAGPKYIEKNVEDLLQ